VIIGAAPFDEVDATVFGVNHDTVQPEHRVLSSVSCTTHALVPLVQILDEAFGLESALMTEIHAVTTDQVVLDRTHRDLAARSGGGSQRHSHHVQQYRGAEAGAAAYGGSRRWLFHPRADAECGRH
jgi:glyceraldehyde-3-phosphate dehydrogenase/erythrose-4-phosphate dehydrogenase